MSETEIEFDEIEAGEYRCTLKIKECEATKWGKDSDGKPTKIGTRPGYRFVFKVQNKNAWINKTVGRTAHERGALFKILQELTNSLLKEITFNAKGFADPEEKLFRLIHELGDKEYMVKCERNGEYVNYVSATPVPPVDPNEVEEVPFGGLPDEPALPPSYEEDDIPF